VSNDNLILYGLAGVGLVLALGKNNKAAANAALPPAAPAGHALGGVSPIGGAGKNVPGGTPLPAPANPAQDLAHVATDFLNSPTGQNVWNGFNGWLGDNLGFHF
jgi:hypothetical protein